MTCVLKFNSNLLIRTPPNYSNCYFFLFSLGVQVNGVLLYFDQSQQTQSTNQHNEPIWSLLCLKAAKFGGGGLILVSNFNQSQWIRFLSSILIPYFRWRTGKSQSVMKQLKKWYIRSAVAVEISLHCRNPHVSSRRCLQRGAMTVQRRT